MYSQAEAFIYMYLINIYIFVHIILSSFQLVVRTHSHTPASVGHFKKIMAERQSAKSWHRSST